MKFKGKKPGHLRHKNKGKSGNKTQGKDKQRKGKAPSD
jgi:hypothetical protein